MEWPDFNKSSIQIINKEEFEKLLKFLGNSPEIVDIGFSEHIIIFNNVELCDIICSELTDKEVEFERFD